MDTRSPNGSSPQQPRSVKKHGITKPISLAGPVEADIQRNTELEKFLIGSGLYESKEGSSKREEVLGHITEIVKSWVKQLTRQKGYTDQMVEEANAVIFTFGSYRLGVHGPGADIDTLCVGPSYVNREEDFFIILRDILAEMEEVTELQPVPDAHVSVMKFKFRGISIDLLYASISLLVVPDDLDISQGSVLLNVDEQTVRSLNGCRVANQILKLVPNVEVSYRISRRCKLGSSSRTVCQLYPNAIPSMLVSRFFRVYTQWRWLNPVMLCSIEEDELGFPVWDPRKNPCDWFHHMPIITPAYPCMNSSYNVSISTLCVMIEQFQYGNKICEAYKNYLQVDIVSADADDLLVWKGWVGSRLRQLTLKIEQDTNGMLQCHPYPNEFVDTSKQFAHCAFFMGLQRKVGVIGQEGSSFLALFSLMDIDCLDHRGIQTSIVEKLVKLSQGHGQVKPDHRRCGDVDGNSVGRLSSGLLDSKERNVEITILQARTDSPGSFTIRGQPSLNVDNLPVVRNAEPAEQMGEPVLRQEFLTACEVPNSETRETCKSSLYQEKIEDLALAYMDDLETGFSRKKLNWKGGGVGVDQEAVKLCNKTAVVETAETNGSENTGSSGDSESRGSLQGGGVCIADLDSLLETDIQMQVVFSKTVCLKN
ncbi:hypothetical protein Goari_004394 [Gossypium aridum]|uniref:polynucleotide adenylyltransferase n=1 Tax=Gossypium aridum TaxID=34290 RepID=A0A7J8Y3S1_GOSAI|nr:hypothetical protein [Gossypium aridum]